MRIIKRVCPNCSQPFLVRLTRRVIEPSKYPTLEQELEAHPEVSQEEDGEAQAKTKKTLVS